VVHELSVRGKIREYGIAVVGDENLVLGFRLAGLSKVYEVSGPEDEVKKNVRKYVSELLEDPEIGVIVLQDTFEKYVEDILEAYRGKSVPVVVSVPGIKGPIHPDVKEYYKQYVKRIIGFAVEF